MRYTLGRYPTKCSIVRIISGSRVERTTAACLTHVVDVQLEELVLRIQTLAFHRALLLVHQRRTVIQTVADELLADEESTVTGKRIDELLEGPPETVDDSVRESLPFAEIMPPEVSQC
jgi:hypothetical protein